jgi:two-component system NtrC family sensor kinase
VESHGGPISVGRSHTVEAGFIVLLPVDAGDAAPVAGEQPEESDAVTTRRILIVDDDDEIGALLEDIVSGDGYRTERATNGREAVEQLAESAFDLILTDLTMPDMGGRELFREIRAHYPEMLSRIIFVTGDAVSHEARTFLEDTGCPVIEKPFTPADVRRNVAARLAQE